MHSASVLLYDDHIVWQVALQHALISANKSQVFKCITNLNEVSCLLQQRTFLICFCFPFVSHCCSVKETLCCLC